MLCEPAPFDLSVALAALFQSVVLFSSFLHGQGCVGLFTVLTVKVTQQVVLVSSQEKLALKSTVGAVELPLLQRHLLHYFFGTVENLVLNPSRRLPNPSRLELSRLNPSRLVPSRPATSRLVPSRHLLFPSRPTFCWPILSNHRSLRRLVFELLDS